MTAWQERVEDQLLQLDQAGLRRRRRTMSGRCSPTRPLDGQPLLNFASNDYLGLAGDPRIAVALASATEQYGTGAGSAQLLGGYCDLHQQLEQALAQWVGRESAVLFSSGYMANLGAIGALVKRGDTIVSDKLNHASLLDGARLSGATLRRYPHLDLEAARRQLRTTVDPALLVTESVFSMDGDLAPLPELAAMCRSQGALLCVDEAHALGVLGPAGAGAAAHAGLTADDAPVLMGALGKSLGTFGAFVAGPLWLTEYLISRARSHIYTTAPPPALAAATLCALEICQTESWRRDHLHMLIRRFRDGAAHLGLPVLPSTTPIQPVVIGASEDASRASAALEAGGIWVPAIRPPTVPVGQSRLRVSLTCCHLPEHVDQLLGALVEVL